jgi:hypothetical protein
MSRLEGGGFYRRFIATTTIAPDGVVFSIAGRSSGGLGLLINCVDFSFTVNQKFG